RVRHRLLVVSLEERELVAVLVQRLPDPVHVPVPEDAEHAGNQPAPLAVPLALLSLQVADERLRRRQPDRRVGHRTTIIGCVSFLVRAGDWDCVTPEGAGWRYLSFCVERVEGEADRLTGPQEAALVLLSGACAVVADGQRFELGPRSSVFEQLPWTLY